MRNRSHTVKVNGRPPGTQVAGTSELSVGVGPPSKTVSGALVEGSERGSPLYTAVMTWVPP